jgi:hypothetical protein
MKRSPVPISSWIFSALALYVMGGLIHTDCQRHKRLVVPRARIPQSIRYLVMIGSMSRVSSRNWSLGVRKLRRPENDGRQPRPSYRKSKHSLIRDSNLGISACR